MNEQLELREFSPKIHSDREILASFLTRHQLKYEEDIEYAVGFCEDGQLLACGCCSGPLLKCFAVEPQLRGQNILGRIVSALVANRFKAGYFEPIVFTRACNREIFVNCGFYPVAETEDLVFLEHRFDGIERFISSLKSMDDLGKKAGAIIVNCNPFTKGHRYLVEYASANCELLHIFVVQENRSAFPFDIRFRLVEQGVSDLQNVQVHAGGNYIISSATFPSYFLKKEDDSVKAQAKLDATLFASRIASPLNINVRFVGTEPNCAVTKQYNTILKSVLPRFGIEVVEIDRCNTMDGEVISASRVRRLLAEGILDKSLLKLVPESTYRYLTSPEAAPVIEKLRDRERVNGIGP
ncbi:MAG TPA: [citrate (pro-3S)-lyase] ligase [Bacillota bacterium]|nr:[citrate (pro-3S)-lyase] ligase [Bacillota bacterium]